MNLFVHTRLAIATGMLAIAAVALFVGVPGSALLGFAPLLACLGMHELMGHGGHRDASPQGAGRPPQE